MFLFDNIICDFIAKLTRSNTAQQSWLVFLDAIEPLGFNSAFYGLSFLDEQQQVPSGLYLSNYQPQFQVAYDELEGAHGAVNDVVVRWCTEMDQPLEWQSAQHLALQTPQNRIIDDLAADFGMNYGVAIPIRSNSSLYTGGIGICAEGVNKKTYDSDIAINVPLAIELSNLFHAHLFQLKNSNLLKMDIRTTMQPFTNNELDTIKWLASGCSIKEIADSKLHKSAESVNLYIKSAKDKMQVKTRDQMIARAVIIGLI